jgi:hypothetical protein
MMMEVVHRHGLEFNGCFALGEIGDGFEELVMVAG